MARNNKCQCEKSDSKQAELGVQNSIGIHILMGRVLGSKLIKKFQIAPNIWTQRVSFGSESLVWPLTKGKQSTANAVSPKGKCINLQEKNKDTLLEKPSQCFFCVFVLREIKRVEMLFIGQCQDMVRTCQNTLI